ARDQRRGVDRRGPDALGVAVARLGLVAADRVAAVAVADPRVHAEIPAVDQVGLAVPVANPGEPGALSIAIARRPLVAGDRIAAVAVADPRVHAEIPAMDQI